MSFEFLMVLVVVSGILLVARIIYCVTYNGGSTIDSLKNMDPGPTSNTELYHSMKLWDRTFNHDHDYDYLGHMRLWQRMIDDEIHHH